MARQRPTRIPMPQATMCLSFKVLMIKVKEERVARTDGRKGNFGPDLAPMDFRVLPEVKSQLRGIRFASKQELTVAAKRIVPSFDADWYRDTFDKWIS
ncbi:hypothetical protein DPMN_088201 [Dreissena polymorpha]|uniref:Uncharacterized protein n=1 Tax=Dreissena polymorpha TaxID=45954 RepID=A0A9D4QWA9_DREPO|nr:hypothetical protein DPMN_088201 [Dreissena polymorpha]